MFLISGRHVLDIARPAVSHPRFCGVRRQRGGGREGTVRPLINSHPPGQGARRPPSSFVEKWTRFTSARATFFFGGGGWVAVVDAPGNNPEGGRNFIIPGLIIQRASL